MATAPRWTTPSAPRATRSWRCRPSASPGRWRTPTTTSRTTGRPSTRPACIPPISEQLSDLAKFPVHGEDRSARQLSVQHVRGAARKAGPRPRLLRHHRQADRGRLHQGRYRHLVGGDGALDPRRRRPHRHDHPQRLWLWPVHRRARRALRRRAARLHRGAGLRRHDRAAGAADQRFQARHHHGDAELHAGDPRRVQAAEARPAQIAR